MGLFYGFSESNQCFLEQGSIIEAADQLAGLSTRLYFPEWQRLLPTTCMQFLPSTGLLTSQPRYWEIRGFGDRSRIWSTTQRSVSLSFYSLIPEELQSGLDIFRNWKNTYEHRGFNRKTSSTDPRRWWVTHSLRLSSAASELFLWLDFYRNGKKKNQYHPPLQKKKKTKKVWVELRLNNCYLESDRITRH